MTRRCIVLIAAGAITAGTSSCTLPAAGGGGSGELGEQFTATVPGTWISEERHGGLIGTARKTFRADGTAEGQLQVKDRSGGVSFVLPTVSFRSKWRVEGDTYISYQIEGSQPGLFKPGQEFRDRILKVSPDRIVCRDEADGGTFTMVREP